MELLLAHRGVDVINLGGRLPTASLIVAARSSGVTAVVVCSHTPTVATHAVRAVRAVAELGLPVYYAGASFESQFVRQNTPGEALDAPLSVSADLLTRRHTRVAMQPSFTRLPAVGELTA